MKTSTLAYIALLAVNLIYGANYIVAKGIMPNFVSPATFILIRVSGAAFLFLLLSQVFYKEKIQKKHLGRFVLCGIFGVTANQLCFFWGLNITSPINASVILTVTPLIVLVLSALILKEKISRNKAIGVALGAIGAGALILNSAQSSDISTASGIGDLLILCNVISYSFYLVLVKPLMAHYKPITVISTVFAIGFCFVLPFGIWKFPDINWSEMPINIIAGIAYVVICTTFLAYLLNIFALKYVSPSVTSAFIYLQPIASALFAYIATSFDDYGNASYISEITPLKIFFTLLIFAGVFLVIHKPKTSPTK